VARGAAPLGGGGSLPRGTPAASNAPPPVPFSNCTSSIITMFQPAVSKAAPPSQPSERQVKRARVSQRDTPDASSELIAMFLPRSSTVSRAAALPPPQVRGMHDPSVGSILTLCPPPPCEGVWPADGRANTPSRVPSGGGATSCLTRQLHLLTTTE
jgi:hypothetical protein